MLLLYINHLKNKANKKRFSILSAVLLGCLFIVFIPVIFQLSEVDLIGLRSSFKLLCHQKLHRFIEFNSYYPFVCAREIGIYTGIVISLQFNVYPYRKLLGISLLILIIEKIIEHLTDVPILNEIRLLVGFLLGVFVASLTQHYFKEKKQVRKPVP